MRWHFCPVLAACFLAAARVSAGMPAPLPTDVAKIIRLNETPLLRLQAISFFLLVFLLSATAIMLLWNYVRRDFPALPRLSFGTAVAAVFLWGLLFIIVLTMISGARELMTPGAWKKQGFTYKLNEPAETTAANRQSVHRQQLERLRTALWQFAALHNGRFPKAEEVSAIATEL